MNRSTAKTLSDEVVDLLNNYFKDQGIVVTKGNGKYDDTSLTVPITFNEPNEDGIVVTKEEMDYLAYSKLFGLDGVPFGSTFTFRNDLYAISGLKPRSRKYPILARQAANGKTYKFPADDVKRLVNLEA